MVRIKGFEEPWELCTLGEHIEDYVEKTIVQNQYPVLTSSQNKGIVRQEDYFANRQVTTDSNIGYFVLPRGFFTYRSRSDNGVFKFNRNDLLDKGIISYFYPVFSIVEGDSDFYLKLLNTSITRQAMLQAEGTGQKVLSLRKFKSIKTLVPSLPEQSAIGSLFRTLDDLLASFKDNLANYQSLKATMLSKMFPKAGQTVPEIRLDGFDDEWEIVKLGDNCRIITGGTPRTGVKEFWNPKEIPWMSSGEINKKILNETEEMISYIGLENSSAKWVKQNSVLIALAGQGQTRGRVAINKIPLTTNQSIAAIETNDNIDFLFLYTDLSRRYDELRLISSGDGTRGGLNKTIISNLELNLPTLEEQQAIGSYFSNLDNLITAHQEKISQLETLKKKLLQDMFV
ncbi:MAG: restriction endonuclease subunit S [Streptococcus xiaochunlingii]